VQATEHPSTTRNLVSLYAIAVHTKFLQACAAKEVAYEDGVFSHVAFIFRRVC
jgi:hypothetical protein